MARIVVAGAGVVGLGTAMVLAADGHDVTVLERDGEPPPASPDGSWGWRRRGVNQFRLPHYFLPRFRAVVEAELPQVAASLAEAGALAHNPLLQIPEVIRGATRPEDHELGSLTARRPVVEWAVARAAAATDGVELRRGVAVTALIAAPARGNAPVCVTGVRTDGGDDIAADLVLDMMGRRSPLPRLLEDAGARPPAEELEDCGFVYYGRHFRSRDGSQPFALGPPVQALGTLSALTLVADHGTWSVVLVASAKDRAMAKLRDTGRWEQVVRALPTVAHWLDGEPLDDRVVTMSKIEDRIRRLAPHGEPVATGVVSVGDAWACSNPSLGRGASLGMMHALVLRRQLRTVGTDDAGDLAAAFAAATAAEVEPWFTWTRAFDRHRLAQIDAALAGGDYRPDDPAWDAEQALGAAAADDPELLRLFVRINSLLALPADDFVGTEHEKRALELGGSWRDRPVPAPSRDELVRIVDA